jgi:lipid-A-disaccharide synthase-like uncharacterized protein
MRFWLVFGLIAQLCFFMRFFIQWMISERKKESYIPMIFWYLSLIGGTGLLIYSIQRKDPVFIVGQSMGIVIYMRNIVLRLQKTKRETNIS